LVLLSAGIGATPVLAMLYALESEGSVRPVLWVHAARDGEHHPFAAEVNRLVHALANARSYVCYSQPGSNDAVGKGFDAAGHLSKRDFDALSVSPDADVYLCGPSRFMADMRETLAKSGVAAERIHVESFNGGERMTPGISGEPRRAPHLPSKQSDTGVRVAFARSGIAVRWEPATYRNILELAEACDVPVRWSCRSGVCHSCESGLVSGSVAYAPEPLDEPADGDVLICCAQPTADVVVDL
jgi:ferredoxin-NADP reductase